MPSMHVAWTTWCAVAVCPTLRTRGQAAVWLAYLFPAATAVVVVATGNHDVLDVVGGVALVAVSTAIVAWVVGRQRRTTLRNST